MLNLPNIHTHTLNHHISVLSEMTQTLVEMRQCTQLFRSSMQILSINIQSLLLVHLAIVCIYKNIAGSDATACGHLGPEHFGT